MIFIKFWAFSPFLILFLIVLIQEVMVIYTYLNPSQTEGIFLVVHHLFLFLIIYTYYLVMNTDAGRPSLEKNEENTKLITLKICKYCQIQKPTRCHHCRQCNRCILRMDHHCPWVNNCIGQNNYKAFFCLITYSSKKFILSVAILSLIYSICYMIKVLSIIEFGNIEIYFIIFNCTLSFAMSILLLLFLGFHIKLISKNQTTLEYFEKNTNYDKGLCNNFREFLGPSFWLFP